MRRALPDAGIALPLALFTLAILTMRGALSAPMPPWDESNYYRWGMGIWHGSLPPWDVSPLYTTLYALIGRLSISPDAAFHAMRAILSVTLVTGAYLALAPLIGRPSAILGAALPTLTAWFAHSTTIYLASAVVTNTALALAVRGRLHLAVILLGIGIGVRPEFAVAAVAVAGVLVLTRYLPWRSLWPIGPLAVVMLGYVAITPRAVSDIPGGRLALAFGQHYAWTMADLGWQGDYWNDWETVMQRDFGAARSLPDALTANPRAVLTHVAHNFTVLPRSVGASLGIVALLVWLPWSGLRRPHVPSRPGLLVNAALLSLIAPWLLIRPRPDYMLALTVPLLLLSAWAMARILAVDWRIYRLALLFILSVLATYGLLTARTGVDPNDSADFSIFYASGRALLLGDNPYHAAPTLLPPFLLPLLSLGARLEFSTTYNIWWAFSVALYVAVVLALMRAYPERKSALMLAWTLVYTPLHSTLYGGQIYIVLTAFAVAAWLALRRGDHLAAGICIGVVVALKPNFALWTAMLFLIGLRRQVVITAITASILTLAPMLWYGPNILIDWLRLGNLAADTGSGKFAEMSLRGFWMRFGLEGLGILSTFIVLGALLWWAWRCRPLPVDVSGAALVGSLLAAPLAWPAYGLVLLPIFFARSWNWSIWASAILFMLPSLNLMDLGRGDTPHPATGIFTVALVFMLAGLLTGPLTQRPYSHIGADATRLPEHDGQEHIALARRQVGE